MYWLRSVGSKQTHNFPLGFLMITKEFNHSGALFLLVSYLDMIPCCSIESSSSLKAFCMAKGTFLGGFCTGLASFCK